MKIEKAIESIKDHVELTLKYYKGDKSDYVVTRLEHIAWELSDLKKYL